MKNFGTVIYKEFNKKCKQQLAKSFDKVISMVPEAELTEKASPVEVKEKKCEEKIELTRMLKILRIKLCKPSPGLAHIICKARNSRILQNHP